MERNNLENLFKDKLEGLVIEPSNEARERFARKIQYRSRSVLIKRFSIAASILLFTFAGIFSFRIFETDKIDLSKGEAFNAGNESAIAVLKNVPNPRSITPGQGEDPIPDNEVVISLRDSSPGNSQTDANGNLAAIAQGNEDIEMDPEIDMEGLAGADQEYDELTAGQEDKNAYIEYFVADPDLMDHVEEVSTADQEREPMKITIEYIASGDKGKQSESKRSNFYSKLDNMKTMDEVLGDIRTYKDKLFALDFRKEEKVNNKEKSTE